MIQNIKGTKDILPSEIGQWQRVEEVIRKVCAAYSYEEIRTPIIESADLFRKSAGEGSDVVSKEMYSFPDRSDDLICLRPELTAPVARAVAQYTMLRAQPTLRLWYYGACFRYERPQLGRQRQFHQIGAECIGSAHPEADAEIISLAHQLIQDCGIKECSLQINSLGSAETRALYRQKLIEYLRQYTADLSLDSQRRLDTNPLRILDSKDETDRQILTQAPKLIDSLDEVSAKHFQDVQRFLHACNVPFVINPLLVRGLDYYTNTVFEFKTEQLGAQDAIGGGGRYDNLLESLQAQPAPGVGFGIGLERLILLSAQQSEEQSQSQSVDSYIVCDSQYSDIALQLAKGIRQAGFSCRLDLQHRSFKNQMKEADKVGAKQVFILGETEIADKSLTIKDMASGTQQTISYDIDNAVNVLSH